MHTVILITSRFPFYPGEQFLETEIKYWAEQKEIKVVIMPLSTGNGKVRELPNNIGLDLSLVIKTSKVKKYLLIFKSLFRFETYKNAFKDGALNHRFPIFLQHNSHFLERLPITEQLLEKKSPISNITFYTYWNSTQTYVLQTLKKRYGFKLVSRVHGADIYQERRLFGYMPLKKQFKENIDAIYTIVNSANIYLNLIYGYPLKILKTSRLGVSDKKIITKPTEEPYKLHVVSCSSIIPIKRLDKIIDALDIVARKNSRLSITWSHIGSGEIENKVKDYISKKKVLFSYNFVGDLENEKVFEFYKSQRIDVFINTSESEGVPVSIMEVMSCHIPVIAPNVGGIDDIVEHNFNGILLSAECKINEIVEALFDFSFFKREDVRENAYETYLNKYSADKNYPIFINEIKNIHKE